jgi:hypothetical protein
MNKNQAVITTKFVVFKKSPILYVYRDDDGTWQFLGPEENLNEEDASVVSLEEILQLDPTLEKILNININCEARRRDINSEWIILDKR